MKINKNNYLLKISYDGSNYSGRQVQPKVKTIQNYIEEGIKKKEFVDLDPGLLMKAIGGLFHQ